MDLCLHLCGGSILRLDTSRREKIVADEPDTRLYAVGSGTVSGISAGGSGGVVNLRKVSVHAEPI